jgi:hypothetical protein
LLLLSGKAALGQAAPPAAGSTQGAQRDQAFLEQALGVNELELRLGRLGVKGSALMSAEQRQTLARVESQSGSNFDAAFQQTVDAGHVKELAMYHSEVDQAADPQLRALAEQRVAKLAQAVSKAERSKAQSRSEW